MEILDLLVKIFGGLFVVTIMYSFFTNKICDKVIVPLGRIVVLLLLGYAVGLTFTGV